MSIARSNKFLHESRLEELRNRGNEIKADLKAISLQLQCEALEDDKISELSERQKRLESQLTTVEQRLKDLYK